MKNKIWFITAMMMFLTISISAQSRFSVGLVGSRFQNFGSNNRLSEIKNPVGYGMILSYNLNKEAVVAFTGEYFNSDMEKFSGKETDFRGHLSLYVMPFRLETLKPYFSAGIVYTNRKLEYGSGIPDDTKNIFSGRFGAGVDYNLISNISLNFDLGIYSDGLNMNGWSSSVGLRYALGM